MATRQARVWVDLSDRENADAVFDPESLPVSIETAAPGAGDAQGVSYRLIAPFHEQITTNTVMRFVDRHDQAHTLIVQGVQNVGMLGREMVILAEEVLTP